MLVVKTVEGVVRLTGRAPFEKSTRSADTGLIGALGLVGCLETKSRRRRRREDRGKYQAPTLRHGGTATSSQHMLVGAASPRPASPTLDPPSFLRPEQAFQPYKEDNDDETGYIMRAWQPFPPGHVYQPVDTPGASTTAAASVSEALPTETPTTTTSGFTRVGGGRARFESPFAITTQGAASSALTQPPPQITTPGSLPPGAKAPRVPSSHFRAESQSAIVEHMGPIGRPGSRLSGVISLSDPPVINDPNTTGNSTPSPKRGWFGLRSASSSSHDPEVEANATRWNIFKSSRGNSEGSGNALDVEPGHEEMGSKSFMVVRKKGANSRAVTPIEGGSITPDRAHPPSSFVVVRPGRPSIPRSNSQAELASLDPRPPRPKMARRPSSSGN